MSEQQTPTPAATPKSGRSNKKSSAPSVSASKRPSKTKSSAGAEELEQLPPAVMPPGWPEDKPPPTPQETKRARIFEIAQLMASGEWRSSMAKTLAKAWSTPQWQVSVKTVQHYSAEASRLLDYTTGQRETLVKIARLRLLEIAQQNENDRVPALRTMLENLGELRQHHVVQPVDQFAGWTEAEIQEYANTGVIPERHRGASRKT